MEFSNISVYNMDNAIRGMRNPKDSWSKSDSTVDYSPSIENNIYFAPNVILGADDLRLAQLLIKGGSEHRKFLRQIFVSVDITAPRYWWSEFDTYKIGTVANSCSTMHKLQSYPFTLDMFELDEMDKLDTEHWNDTIEYLEYLRNEYNETKDMKIFRKMKQSLPESFKQKRTVTFNYENAFTFDRQRGSHRLCEWREDFMGMLHMLPYSEELIFVK